MLSELNELLASPSPLSIPMLVVNLVLDAILVSVLAWYYLRHGRALTNRSSLARVLPFVSLTTVLIISIVKSSLALSLGLVGALSIVRFRTPIKEPEELAYVFMAIGVGLGMGADQRLPTVTAFVVIMAILWLQALRRQKDRGHNLYLNLEAADNGDSESVFRATTELLSEHVSFADLRRLDSRDGMIQATFSIGCADDQALVSVMENLRRGLKDVAITVVDQNQSLQE